MATNEQPEEEELNNTNTERYQEGTTNARRSRRRRVSFSETIVASLHVFDRDDDDDGEDEDEVLQCLKDLGGDDDDAVDKGSNCKDSMDMRLVGESSSRCDYSEFYLRLGALLADNNTDLLTSTPSHPTKASEIPRVGVNRNSVTNLTDYVEVEPVHDGIHDREAEAESFPITELSNVNGYSTISTGEMAHTSDDGLAVHASYQYQSQSSDHVKQEGRQLNPSKNSIDDEIETDESKTKICDSGRCDEEDTSQGLRQDSPIPYGFDQQLLSPLTACKSSITEQRHVSSATNEIPNSDAEQKYRPDGKDWQKEAEAFNFQTPLREIETSNNQLGNPDESLQTGRWSDMFRMTLRGGKIISSPGPEVSPLVTRRRTVESLHKKGLRSPSREHSGSKTPSDCKRRHDQLVLMNKNQTEGTSSIQHSPQFREGGFSNSMTLLKQPNESDNEGICRIKKGKKGGTRKVRNYCFWDADMDRELAKTLREERNLGNQSDGKLKTSAYNSAASSLSIHFAKKITTTNVRNRLVSWKRMYAIVSNILSQSGFSWDSSKQMIAVDDELEWENYVTYHEGAKHLRQKVIPNWDDICDFFSKELATNVTETPLDANNGVMLNDTDSIAVDKASHSEDSNDMSFVGENASRCDYSNLSPIVDALLADNNTNFLTSTPSYPTKESEFHRVSVNSNSATNLKDSVDVEPVDDGTHDKAAEAESFPKAELSNAIGYSTIYAEEMAHTSDDGLAEHASFQNVCILNQEDRLFNPSKDSINDEFETDRSETKICDSGRCDEEDTSQGLTQDSPIPYGSDQQLLSPLTASKSSFAKQRHITSLRNEIPNSEAEQIYGPNHQSALAEVESSLSVKDWKTVFDSTNSPRQHKVFTPENWAGSILSQESIRQIRSDTNKSRDLLTVLLEEQLLKKDPKNAEYVTRTNIDSSVIETPKSLKKTIQTPETSTIKNSEPAVISSSQLTMSGTKMPHNLSVSQNYSTPVFAYSRRTTSFDGTILQNGKDLQKEVEAFNFQTPLREIETSNTQLGSADERLQTGKGSDILKMTARGGKNICYPSPSVSPLRSTVESLHEKGLWIPSRKHSGDVLRIDNVHHGKSSNRRKRQCDELVLMNEDQTEETSNIQHCPHLGLAGLSNSMILFKQPIESNDEGICRMKKRQKYDTGGDQNYICWNADMHRKLAKTLREETNLGNQSDGKLKTSAYSSAASNLSIELAKNITTDNVMPWKKYAIVSNLLSQSGFGRDSSKQMIAVDEEFVLNDYVKYNQGAKFFRREVVSTWDEAGDFCAIERATDVTEIPLDASNGDMLNDTDSIGNSQSDDSMSRSTQHHKLGKSLPSIKTSCSTVKIMGRLDKMEETITTMASSITTMTSSITDMTNSMAVYFNSKPKEVDIDDLYDTVSTIPELSEGTFFRVCNWLMEDEIKFRFLKKLPEDKRKRYVLQYMR